MRMLTSYPKGFEENLGMKIDHGMGRIQAKMMIEGEQPVSKWII